MKHFDRKEDKDRERDNVGTHRVWWVLVLILGWAAFAGNFSTQTSKAQGSEAYFLPIISVNYQLTGEVTGVVLNSADAVTPIPNAQVCLFDNSICVISDALGAYTLTGVPLGTTDITASAFGFFDQTETVEVNYNQVNRADIYLIPSITEGDVRIVLTWGNRSDLDAHLWLPPTTPIHIYWRFLADCGFFPFACLDKDDFAFGPETIRIRQQLPGNYVFAVYKFETGNIVYASPQVNVYDSNGLVATFEIPEDGRGRWWHVFDLDGFTGNITLVNEVTSTNPAPYDPSTSEIPDLSIEPRIIKR